MLTNEIIILLVTAASIGFFHTLFGPDHYLPFIVISKARSWSIGKTALITFLCGLGHVGSSVVLGFIGVALGLAVHKIEIFEGVRGSIAAWVLMAFGLVYFIWGVRRAIKSKPHSHLHTHSDGTSHAHDHSHFKEHSHIHAEEGKTNITPWALFIIFVLGPCEPLIPLLMYPAAQSNVGGLILVTAVFSAVTIATMMSIVIVVSMGLNVLPMGKLERYASAMAGAAIFLSGAAIQFLGL
ncbi:sulfite exporter TauE/SafE family protein [bacterium]|nr:sulfite exporter TauE/SafE family protein [bacterium]